MRVVLFSRVPRWYSFKNERLAQRLKAAGHEVTGVVVEQTSTIKSLVEWKNKLGTDVFIKKVGQKFWGAKPTNLSKLKQQLPEVSPEVFFVKSHNSPDCVRILKKLEPDMIVLRGCGIIKKQVLDIPKIGVINPHYAKLPDFRGMDVTEWSILLGAEAAVCVHTVNEGVDTGVVLKYRRMEITKEDTVGSLRDKSAAVVVDLLTEAVSDFGSDKKFPKDVIIEGGGHQYFQMHSRLKELANLRIKKFAE